MTDSAPTDHYETVPSGGCGGFVQSAPLHERLNRSDWIVCAEVTRVMGESPSICGVISMSGPNGEPLACGYWPAHDGPHSWSTLPTWPAHSPQDGH